MQRAAFRQPSLLPLLLLLPSLLAALSAAAGISYDPLGGAFGLGAAGGAAGGGLVQGGCVTPSVLLPRSRSEVAACNADHSVADLTDGEWLDLKWGTIEVMCRRSNQTLVFYLKNYPRFGWNPLKSVTSAVRRFAGSVDMRSASVPLRPVCECDHRTFPPFYAEVFKKEQYLTGAKVQNAPRRVYEFLGEKTPCEPPQVWGSPLSVGAFPAGSLPGSSLGRPFEFQELRRCLWKIELPYKPRVYGARNEVMVSLPAAADPATAAAVQAAAAAASAAAAAAAGDLQNPSPMGPAPQGHLSLSLPPACHMHEVDKELRVWIRPSSAAAAGVVRPEQQMFEVYVEVTPSPLTLADALYYHRMNTVGDFVLAVERGQ